LPHSIADRIKQGERMIADPFDSVSIFFADIVGFTDLSTKISATELITLLNTIFITMDRIATIYQIEKIKTIGDAYMAVSGLPVPNVNHASNMAIFAKSVLTEMKSLDSFIRSNIDMRIGIHCGPVVAGIIGEHKFSYDIWGDSVNTASRMESHGEPGKIHISEEFKNALAGYDEFSFTARKPMYIKGKGMMNTFFLS
jgi:class 3 adenylate cyclase